MENFFGNLETSKDMIFSEEARKSCRGPCQYYLPSPLFITMTIQAEAD